MDAPGKIRTCDTRIRNPVLYPLSYGGDVPAYECFFAGRRRGFSRPYIASYIISTRDLRPRAPVVRLRNVATGLLTADGRLGAPLPSVGGAHSNRPGTFEPPPRKCVRARVTLGYKDLDDPAKKEHLTRIGLLGLGEYIWGDRGARHAPDLLRVEAADRAVAEAEAAIADAKRRRETLRDEQRGVMHVSDRDIAAADLSEADRNVRLFQAQQLSLAIDDVNDEIQRGTERLGDAKLEAERARASLVPVDDFDDVPEVPAGAAPAPPIVAHVRDRVTAAEAAKAFDVSVQTMRRWFKGQMPHAAGDPRNPWDPGANGELPECILDLGPRSRWLVIDRLDPHRISPGVMAALRGAQTVMPGPPRCFTLAAP